MGLDWELHGNFSKLSQSEGNISQRGLGFRIGSTIKWIMRLGFTVYGLIRVFEARVLLSRVTNRLSLQFEDLWHIFNLPTKSPEA